MQPIISVIIPVYKAEKYLHRCLNSVLTQTFRDIEILLINDGSPDKSGEICEEYAARDSRVKVFHKENGGVSSARNLGIKKAVGEWITFVDADDWLEPNVLSIVEDISVNSTSDFIQYGYQRVRNSVVITEKYLPKQPIHISSDIYNNANYYHCAICGYFIKNRTIRENAIQFPINIKYGEDQAFILKVLLLSNSCYVSNLYGYNYFDNPSSAMNASWGIIRAKNSLDCIEDVVYFAQNRGLKLPKLHKYILTKFAQSYIWQAIKCVNCSQDFRKVRNIYDNFIKAIEGKGLSLRKYNNFFVFFVLLLMYKVGLKK